MTGPEGTVWFVGEPQECRGLYGMSVVSVSLNPCRQKHLLHCTNCRDLIDEAAQAVVEYQCRLLLSGTFGVTAPLADPVLINSRLGISPVCCIRSLSSEVSSVGDWRTKQR